MKYYIIAGEASGDLHASNLMKAIRRKDPDAEFRGWGGDKMKAEGAVMVRHYRETAFMGFWEVLVHLRKILGFIRQCKLDIQQYQPDKLILVDYPGFNLRIAEFARKEGIPVYYYISPQVWAWKASRVHRIKRDVHQMIVILPFEEAFYAKYDMKVHFVGHPLLDVIDPSFTDEENEDDKRKIIALLPGSRQQEISNMLPVMLQAAGAFPEYRFVIAAAPSVDESFYKQCSGKIPVELMRDVRGLLSKATAALVTSGTATLETGLFGVPQVVCYKGSALSFFIARLLVKIKYISLVNLILDKEAVKELIQGDLNKENVTKELASILPGGNKREDMITQYKDLRKSLGGQGASDRAAQIILEL
ncbi:MAG: lipid-A-disaccharide synthase [Flavobacteriales bacterium]|nr:lipid-A-disaccharide synthase [Flavobacteriales bacterium]